MANNLDLVKFVIENVVDPKTGQYIDLDKIDANIKSVYSSAKSAVNPDTFLSIREKVVDEVTGHFYTEIITEATKANALQSAVKQRIQKLGGLAVGNALPMQTLSGHKTFHSKEAMKLAMDDIIARGGEFYHDPTALNADRYAYTVPVDPNVKINSKLKNSLFANNQSSKVETAYNTKKRNDAQAKEDEKKKKAKEKENLKKQKEDEKKRFQKAKEEAKVRKDAETEKAKKREENKRALKRDTIKAIAILTLIANITRRILSSLMSYATQAQKDTIEANNLGVSYQTIRQARYAETALGLNEGVITGAMSDVQSMFGNITMIDEGALEKLALIMGSDIEDLVRSGLGGSNPEQLLEKIVDAFNERANQGYNSVGQYVGEQQARRELYSLLSKVSPQIASIFASLNEAQHNPNSLYRGVEGYSDLISATMPDIAKLTEAETGLLYTLSELNKSIKSLWEQMKEAITVKLSPTLMRLLEKIANSRLFMDDTESLALDIENRSKNEVFIKQMEERKAEKQKELKKLTGTDKIEAEAYIDYIDYFIKQAKKQNEKEKGVADVGRTATEARLNVLAGLGAKKTAKMVLEGGDLFYGGALKQTFSEDYLKAGRASAVSFLGGENAYQAKLKEAKKNYLGTAEGMLYRMNFSSDALPEAPVAPEEPKKPDYNALTKELKGKEKRDEKARLKTEYEAEVKAYKQALPKYEEDLAEYQNIVEQLVIESVPEEKAFMYLLESYPKLENEIKKAVLSEIDKETQSKGLQDSIKSAKDKPDETALAPEVKPYQLGIDTSKSYFIGGNSAVAGKDGIYKVVLDINGDGIQDNKNMVIFSSDRGFTGAEGDLGEYANGIVKLNASVE